MSFSPMCNKTARLKLCAYSRGDKTTTVCVSSVNYLQHTSYRAMTYRSLLITVNIWQALCLNSLPSTLASICLRSAGHLRHTGNLMCFGAASVRAPSADMPDLWDPKPPQPQGFERETIDMCDGTKIWDHVRSLYPAVGLGLCPFSNRQSDSGRSVRAAMLTSVAS